jgi:hypothetical protein
MIDPSGRPRVAAANSPYCQQGAPHGSVDSNCLQRICRASRVKAAVLPQQRRDEATVGPDHDTEHLGAQAHARPPVTRSSAAPRSSTSLEYFVSRTRSFARTTTSYPPTGPSCRKAALILRFTRLRATAPRLHLTASPSLDGSSGTEFTTATATRPSREARRPFSSTRRKSRPLRREGGFLTRSQVRWRLGRKPGAAFGPPVLEDRTASPRLHPGAKPVLALTPPNIWLKGSLCHGASPSLSRFVPPWTPPEQVANLRGIFGVSQEYSGIAFVHVNDTSRGREGVFHIALDSRPSALRRIRSASYFGQRARDRGTSPRRFSGGVATPSVVGKVVHTCGYPC